MKTLPKFLAILTICATAGTAGAQLVTSTEYFDYSGTGDVTALNGGSGWNGAWTTASTTSVLNGSSNLTFANANYGTPTVTNNNMATTTGTTSLGNARSFTSVATTSEVWMSFLGSAATGTNNLSILRPNAQSTSGVGIQSGAFYAKLNNLDLTLTGAPTYTSGTTYLFLMKLESNVSGTNDRLSAWIFDASASINPLTLNDSPMGTLTSSSTVWTNLSSITMNVRTATGSTVSNMDNIRIAYGGTTQENINAVLAVPEPTTWALLAGSLTTLMIFRRRRNI